MKLSVLASRGFVSIKVFIIDLGYSLAALCTHLSVYDIFKVQMVFLDYLHELCGFDII